MASGIHASRLCGVFGGVRGMTVCPHPFEAMGVSTRADRDNEMMLTHMPYEFPGAAAANDQR